MNYIRYVDDFVILHDDCIILGQFKEEINEYLVKNLQIELHPDKTKIMQLKSGISLLGYRVFYYHKLLRKANKRKFRQKLKMQENGEIPRKDFLQSLQGWLGYAMWANTYKLRNNLIKKVIGKNQMKDKP